MANVSVLCRILFILRLEEIVHSDCKREAVTALKRAQKSNTPDCAETKSVCENIIIEVESEDSQRLK